MIKTAQALYQFFSQFGIPAYAEDTIPQNAELPYLTYSNVDPDWREQRTIHVQVYYRNQTSNLASLTKADEIMAEIGDCRKLPFDGGLVVLRPVDVQPKPPDGSVRAAVISLTINAYHMPGV